jgi:frataxin-like iron-binding protein CyaY
MAAPSSTKAFDQFWKWLKSRRKAPTLGHQSHVFCKVEGGALVIRSSEGKSYIVSRQAAGNYCWEASKKKFDGLVANKRWVAALYRDFLES